MGKLTMDDVFKAMAKPLPEFEVKPGKTALVLIDMQNLIGSDELIQEAVEGGLPELEVRELLVEHDRVIRAAVENARKILTVCRQKGYDVVHVRLAAPTEDPRHTAKVNRKAGFILPATSEKARFLEEMKPIEGELLFDKTNGGAFTGTNLDFVLRNMDITGIIAAGFLTDQCVLATVVYAGDVGYDVLLVSDACAGTTPENHEAVLRISSDVFLKVKSTEELLGML
jgi:nicotinamidase-related amidase